MKDIQSLPSPAVLMSAAIELGCQPEELIVSKVNGGYSHNRRGLLKYGGKGYFAKEIDLTLVAGDGTQEREWLYKDFACWEMIHTAAPEIVADWAKLYDDGDFLLTTSYSQDHGWVWRPPQDRLLQTRYVESVLASIERFATILPTNEEIDRLKLTPYIRDLIVENSGLDMIASDPKVRDELHKQYEILSKKVDSGIVRDAIRAIQGIIDNDSAIQSLICAKNQLQTQPEPILGHGDVRADNITYNPNLNQAILVDLDWVSFMPEGFDATEFLIDIVRYGVDITPWLRLLNKDLLAATVGYYVRRALEDSDNREALKNLKLESAAIAAWLYGRVK